MFVSAVRLGVLAWERLEPASSGRQRNCSGFVFQPRGLLLLLGPCTRACFDVGPCMQQRKSSVSGWVSCVNGSALRLPSCSSPRSHIGTCIYRL